MWLILIIIAILSIWQIGLTAFAKGIKNGAKKTINYYEKHRRER